MLSSAEKVNIIFRCEANEGKRQSQTAKELGILESILSRIFAKKEELKEVAAVSGCWKIQKFCEYSEAEKSVLEWCKQNILPQS